MIVLEAALAGAALLLLVPTGVLVVEVLAALRSSRTAQRLAQTRPLIAVLMPAHDEAAVIAATVGGILPQLNPGDRLLVVADNCGDATAQVAAGAGAEVIERSDSARRGKGFALDFGVRYLERDPRPVVIVVDADCTLEDGALGRLAARALDADAPVQALYLIHPPAGAGLESRIAAFAWVVRNHVRPLGLHRMGLPCHLMGTGMAFPWKLLRTAPVASGEIVEDMKLGIDLARAGHAPRFCPEAVVQSELPASEQGRATQMARWEHGHLRLLLGEVPGLLAGALKRRDAGLLALALELAVPPLALLALLVGGVFVGCLALSFAGGGGIALGLAIACAALFAAAVLIAWLRFGREAITLGELLYAPFYAIGKLPLYLQFIARRQSEWVRTRRDGE